MKTRNLKANHLNNDEQNFWSLGQIVAKNSYGGGGWDGVYPIWTKVNIMFDPWNRLQQLRVGF